MPTKQSSPMEKTTILVAAVLFLLVASLPSLLQQQVSRQEVFGDGGDQTKRARMAMDVVDILRLKFRHAENSQPFDFGLFGNSRAIALSADDLGLDAKRFFNFSVGGTSFEQSVVFLRKLDEINRVPKTVFISVDHFDLGYFGAPYFPTAIELTDWYVKLMIDDLSQGKSPFSRLRSYMSRVIYQMESYFNIDRMWRQFAFLANLGRGYSALPYRSDGSLPESVPSGGGSMALPAPTGISSSQITTNTSSLEFIYQLSERGAKIILYESPIHPRLLNQIDEGRQEATKRARAIFFEKCKKLNLTCLPPPVIESELPWLDCCHAPASDLGAFLRRLI